MKDRAYKAITFDLWNTLLDGGTAGHINDRVNILQSACNKVGCRRDKKLIESTYYESFKIWESAWRKEQKSISAKELINYILKQLDIDFDEQTKDDVIRGFEDAIIEDPPGLLNDARLVLEKLQRRYKIGLICDTGYTPGRALRVVLKKHDILKYFSSLVFSNEVGMTKPNPAVFNIILENFDVVADEAVHVGDLLETDIAGAKAIGMAAIWLNQNKKKIDRKSTRYLPDYEISSLGELFDIIEP